MKDYIARAPRIIMGNLVIGFIERNNEEKANEAFGDFCSELMCGKQIYLACKITKKRTKTALTVKAPTVKEGPKSYYPQEKPAFEVYVG